MLEAAAVKISVENPAKIRHYALSHGWLEKTDRLDPQMLAEFARERRPRPRRKPDPQVEALSKLAALSAVRSEPNAGLLVLMGEFFPCRLTSYTVATSLPSSPGPLLQ